MWRAVGVVSVLVALAAVGGLVLVLAARDGRYEDGAVPGPAFLAMTAAPRTVLADAEPIEALFIQVIDAQGAAVAAATPVTVRLASNDTRVVTVPLSVEVPAGESAVAVPITALREGTAAITGQAPGLPASQAQVEVRGVAATTHAAALGLEFSPRTFIAGAGGPSFLTVSLLVATDAPPTPATSDLEVRLVSSAPDVLAVPASVTIRAGESSASVSVRAGVAGAATVSALRSGLSAASRDTRVARAAASPDGLRVIAMPGKIVAGVSAGPQLVIQAMSGDAPGYFPCGGALQLSSSEPTVIAVPDEATPACEPGWQAVTVPTIAGSAGGATTITVAREGMGAGQVAIDAPGVAPARLALATAPPAILYGARSAGWLVVQVLDVNGAPARVGNDLPLAVTVTGADGVLPSSIVVPRGRSSIAVRLGPLQRGTLPSVRVSGSGVATAELTIRAATASLPPASAASGGAPSPSFTIGGLRVPVLWVFATAVLALLGLLCVIAWSNRRGLNAQL